jgi:hypothetical protein
VTKPERAPSERAAAIGWRGTVLARTLMPRARRCAASRHRLRTGLAALVGAGAVLGLSVAPSANADPPRYQCPPRVANCTTVAGAWIDVPPSRGPYFGSADDELTCPSGEPVGYTYEGGADVAWVLVQFFRDRPVTRDPWDPQIGPGTVFFHILNIDSSATTVRDRIGCAPTNDTTAASSRASGSEVERVWSQQIGRSQLRSYRYGCPDGRRQVSADSTVEFLTRRRPSHAELTAVTLRDRARGTGETVRVTTTARLPRRAGAVLKTYQFCDA